jgi:hypothetical protein
MRSPSAAREDRVRGPTREPAAREALRSRVVRSANGKYSLCILTSHQKKVGSSRRSSGIHGRRLR